MLDHPWFNDFEMKSEAHKIMMIASPLKRCHEQIIAKDVEIQKSKKRRYNWLINWLPKYLFFVDSNE